MSSGSEEELPEWVKTFSPPIAGTARNSNKSSHTDSDDEEEIRPAPSKAADKKSKKLPAAMHAAEAEDAATHREGPTTLDEIPSTQENLTQPTTQSEAALKGDIAVILPDKITATKFLLELQASDNHATELSGDAGAVGRVIMNSSSSTTGPSDSLFQIDLKGVLYHASIVPLAGTAFVLNLGSTEAKVEAVMHDFVRLTEEVTLAMEEAMEGDIGELLGSDDEVYQVQDEGGGGADGATGAAAVPTKKKQGSSLKAKRSSGVGSKVASGGVKKVKKAGTIKKSKSASGKEVGKAPAMKAAAAVKRAPDAAKKPRSKADASQGKAATKPRAANKKAKQAASRIDDDDEEPDEESEGDDEDDEDY